MRTNFFRGLALASVSIAGLASGQQPPSPPAGEWLPVGRLAIPGSSYEIVFGRAEPAAGDATQWPTRPAAVVLYVLDGEFWYWIDGQPVTRYMVRGADDVVERAFPNGLPPPAPPTAMALYIVDRGRPAGAAPAPASP